VKRLTPSQVGKARTSSGAPSSRMSPCVTAPEKSAYRGGRRRTPARRRSRQVRLAPRIVCIDTMTRSWMQFGPSGMLGFEIVEVFVLRQTGEDAGALRLVDAVRVTTTLGARAARSKRSQAGRTARQIGRPAWCAGEAPRATVEIRPGNVGHTDNAPSQRCARVSPSKAPGRFSAVSNAIDPMPLSPSGRCQNVDKPSSHPAIASAYSAERQGGTGWGEPAARRLVQVA
jgi:hypothetical protein